MFNLRYHIASLVAVFLALSIGLLLGTVVVERGALTDQGTQIVRDLQQEFDDLRQDNADLRAGLERDRLFAAEAVPVIVNGALEGRSILVVTNTGRADGLAATVQAIENAGGEAVVMTMESVSFGVDEVDPEALEIALGQSVTDDATATADASADIVARVAAALAHEWTVAGGSRPVTDLLVSSGQIGVGSVEDTTTVTGMALIASWDDAVDPGALALADELTVRGATVVGVEAASSTTGVVAAAVAEGFSAVDDVASSQGAVSLVWILSGRAVGYFGVRDGATGPYPILTEVVD